jgi:hypothetical protein
MRMSRKMNIRTTNRVSMVMKENNEIESSTDNGVISDGRTSKNSNR